MKCSALGVVFCSSFLWVGPGLPPSETLVITNVNVVDTRHGGLVPKVNVVIKDGVIAAISKVALVETGPHNRLVNAEGRYLIPGLWDMHARLSQHAAWNRGSGLILYLVNGVTGLRDPDGAEEKHAETNADAMLSPEIAKRGLSPHPELGIVEFDAIGGLEQADLDSSPGAWLHREMEELVNTGSTPLQALQSATYNAALYMAKLDEYGVIERGHIADMVLLDENPLDDIRNAEKVSAVVLRGRYFSRADLDIVRARAELNADRTLGGLKATDTKAPNTNAAQ